MDEGGSLRGGPADQLGLRSTSNNPASQSNSLTSAGQGLAGGSSGPNSQGRPSRPNSRNGAPQGSANNAASASVEELSAILEVWNAEFRSTGFDPKPTLQRMCELVEKETDIYLKQDPDPFDDRHPSRTHPSVPFGHLLKVIFKNEDFITKLVVSYLLARDDVPLSTLSARLLLDCLPGLDSSVVFQETEDLVPQLFRWADGAADEPLRSYALGLLASAMEVSELASNYREQNAHLVPVILQRLWLIKKEQVDTRSKLCSTSSREPSIGPFAGLKPETFSNNCSRPTLAQVFLVEQCAPRTVPAVNRADTSANTTTTAVGGALASPCENSTAHHAVNGNGGGDDGDSVVVVDAHTPSTPVPSLNEAIRIGASTPVAPLPVLPPLTNDRRSSSTSPPPNKRLRPGGYPTSDNGWKAGGSGGSGVFLSSNISNSSWTDLEPYVIGKHCMFPVSTVMQQRFMLQYLTPTGEYQDMVVFAFEHSALELIFGYIDLSRNIDVRLAFDALKYLASLLVHRKFALEFVAHDGISRLINVYRPSLASVAVATCLYYLAYNNDVFEKVCLLPSTSIDDVVDYALWVLEHSYESGRSSATMFLSYAFAFRPILDRFDQRDGLRRLYNYVSTLTILQDDNDDRDLSDDHMFTSLQAVRNVCAALKSYFYAHLYVKVEHLKRTQGSRLANLPNVTLPAAVACSIPSSKAMHLDNASVQDGVRSLLHVLPMNVHWRPVEELRSLGAVRTLLYFLAQCNEWSSFGSKAERSETMRNCLQVVWICSVVARVQLDLTETLQIGGQAVEGVGLLLEACEGELVTGDTELQIIALNVVINCVCAPFERIGGGRLTFGQHEMDRYQPKSVGNSSSARRSKTTHMDAGDVLRRMWESVRRNNGIMILNNLLHVSTPITEADELRAVACHALNGLARSDVVRQILGKMPLLFNNDLHSLMREPVLQDKQNEHRKFCEQARSLIESVTQKPISDFPKDMTQQKLWNAYVVSQTRIVFNEKELLQLVQQHLLKKGLRKTAAVLQQEAELPSVPASLVASTPSSIGPMPRILALNSSSIASTPSTSTEAGSATPVRPLSSAFNSVASTSGVSRLQPQLQNRGRLPARGTPRHSAADRSAMIGGISALLNSSAATPTTSAPITPAPAQPQADTQHGRSGNRTSGFSTPVGPSTSGHARTTTTGGVGGNNSNSQVQPQLQHQSLGRLRLSPSKWHSVGYRTPIGSEKMSLKPYKGLDDIIQDYFRQQHAMCANPVAACPPFSLFYPHRCPEPKLKRSAPHNLASRLPQRTVFPVGGGYDGVRCDRRFVFSRFKSCRTIAEEEETFTCCSFTADDEHILLGTYAGEVRWYNVTTGSEESIHQCHNSAVTGIEQSEDGSLMLSSSAFVRPLSSLWSVGESLEHRLDFPDEYYVGYGPRPYDRAIGTHGEKASIYDLTTGSCLVELYDESLASHYQRNKALFHPSEELVLNDGVLWDPRTRNAIHKFDKLNASDSGTFHPRGLEAIINTEVWDIRTYRLLHTVPALDQCKLVFSGTGDIIYAAMHMETDDQEMENFRQPFGSAFRTFDATDYRVITTVDIKKPLFDICADHNDAYMAVVETHTGSDDLLALEKNLCRVYEVGKTKDAEDLDQTEDGGDGDDDEDEEEEDDEIGDDEDEDDDDDRDEIDLATGSSSENSDDDVSSLSEPVNSSDDSDHGEVDTTGAQNIAIALDSSDSDDAEYAVGDGSHHGHDAVAVVGGGGDDSDDEGDDEEGNNEEDSEDDEDEVEGEDGSYDPSAVEGSSGSSADESYTPRHGTSSIVLNPTLRRQQRNNRR